MNYAQQVYSLFSPYFKRENDSLLKDRGLRRILVLLGITIFCITSAVSVIYLYDSLSALQSILMMKDATFNTIAWGVLGCVWPSGFAAGFSALTHVASVWLSKELFYLLSEKYIRKWINEKSYYGLKFINQKGEKVNVAEILSTDLKKVSETSVHLFSALVSSFSSAVVGVIQLGYLSSSISFSLWTLPIIIPFPMVILAVGYAVIYSHLVNYFDKDLSAHDEALRKKHSEFMADVYHVQSNAESIELKKGGAKERDRLIKNLHDLDKVENTSLISQAILGFTKSVSSSISYVIGLLLTAPSAMAGKFDIFKAVSVSMYFTNVVKFFSWKKENTTEMASLDVSLKRIKAFDELMKQWNEIEKRSGLVVEKQSNTFGVKNLSVQNPEGGKIFENITFKLPKGQATVITGPSGIGKSTLFRCFSGLWPFAQGRVSLPGNEEDGNPVKIHYIPQQSYFPYNASILDAIVYPQAGTSASKADIAKIKMLMKVFELREDLIRDLEVADEWSKKLSGGEQQKIAIIGAIIKKPDVILIDEGTNALDQKSKETVEKFLKSELPKASVAAIDHGIQTNEDMKNKEKAKSGSLFFDYQLKAQKKKTQKTADFSLHKLADSKKATRKIARAV